jgi:predicted MFS family arabinose efflux permease
MPFAVIVGSSGGWRQALTLAAVPGFIMAILFLLLVSEPPKSTRDTASFEGKPRNSFARWKPLLPLIVAFSAYAFTNWALYTFIPMYLSRKGMGLVEAGLLFAILPFVGVFSKVLGGTLSDRVGREKIITSALVALAPLMYAITVAGDMATIALVLGMLGLVLFSFSPVIYTKVSELYDSSERGRALGTVSSVGNIVGAVSPAAVGFIADRMGFETSFYTIAVVILACAVISAFTMRLNADGAPQSMLARRGDSCHSMISR